MLAYFANLPSCVVGIEACGGAHYWAREINRLGHEARLINPKFAKAYLRGEKNDYNNAAALCEAVVSPQMLFVPLKSEAQQDMQALPVHIPVTYVLLAEAIAVVIGLLAGVFPAYRAARMDPVEALRAE